MLMIWLLAVAIPVQGWAAGTRVACGAAHHGAAAVTAEASASALAHYHRHDHHQMEQAGQGAQDIPAAGAGHKHAGSCSTCAACCVGAAIITAALAIMPVPGTTAVLIAEPSSAYTGHIPDGPERPPRFILS
jgi:hypothetical protein